MNGHRLGLASEGQGLMGCQAGQGGCGRILGFILLLGLLGMTLEKLGCIATDDSLRRGLSVSIVRKEILASKKLFVVHYKVNNGTRWPVSVGLEWAVTATTGAARVTNTEELARIVAHGVMEQRVMFDMDRLKALGLDDPLDADRCSVSYKIVAVRENE